jgi:23S rRNA pseudouridine1911/1915/1917 synthase
MRLDQAVAARFALSRRKARELIASRRILVNERSVAVASREVDESDRIVLVEPDARLDLIASGPDFLAIDKPAGMPTQPPRDRSVRSAEELLRAEYREIYLVHRLDTPTSGVVLFARTRDAAARFSQLFASSAIRKTYVARLAPPLDRESVIDTPIDGREAHTRVRPREDGLVEVEITTGRTHQIRIHLASIGHPVAGDRRYRGTPAERLMLHAWRLEHPSFGRIEAAIPAALVSQ